MLELRINCEHCNVFLDNSSSNAMICSYECTFCTDCVENVLMNVCPNCGGGFERRPSRPKNQLKKYPQRKDKIFKPVIENIYLQKNKDVDPRKR